jgi:hypothetical protein
MPVFQKLINFNTLFSQLSEPPIIINDLANTTELQKDDIKNLVSTRHTGDMISLLPTCRCGMTKGEFSVGVVCTKCGTVVKSTIENEIEPSVWFRKPNGVHKLISPIILIMLKERFKVSGFNTIHWLMDTTYRVPVKQPKVINKIMETGIQRGYNNFINNFTVIMSYLFSMKEFQINKKKKETIDYLKILIDNNLDSIFSDYIPLPNKSLLIVEKNNLGTYVDPIIANAVDAIETLISIDKDFHDQSPRTKENRTAKALVRLSDFYREFYNKDLSPKHGQFRRHVYGSRTNFSFRAVISSLTDTHKYDEIHIPWGIGLTAFEPHILNKLMRLGMDINSAKGLIYGHVSKFHPLLNNILNELLDEAPKKSIYCILQRN